MPLIQKVMQQYKAFIKSPRAIHLYNIFIQGGLEISGEVNISIKRGQDLKNIFKKAKTKTIV